MVVSTEVVLTCALQRKSLFENRGILALVLFMNISCQFFSLFCPVVKQAVLSVGKTDNDNDQNTCFLMQHVAMQLFFFLKMFWAWRVKFVFTKQQVASSALCMPRMCTNRYVSLCYAMALPLCGVELIDTFAAFWSLPWITKCLLLNTSVITRPVEFSSDMY